MGVLDFNEALIALGRSVLLGSRNKKGLYTAEVDELEYEANKASAQVCPMKIIRINRLNK